MTRTRTAIGLRAFCIFIAAFIAGCAAPKSAKEGFGDSKYWQGRIAIQVLSSPRQTFTSDFELQGQSEVGNLTLLSPLGTTVAHMHWAPGAAQLRQGGEVRNFESLSALALQAIGTDLPLSALFDWLNGVLTPAPGWDVDLSRLPEGRLQARRAADSSPAVELKIILVP